MTPPTVDEELADRVKGAGSMDLDRLAGLGALRRRSLETAEVALANIVDEVARAGDDANVALAASLAGVTRTTIYRRLARQRDEAE